ncbi:MAG: hypothetical protein P4L40_15480 [Terracidiphilus sp.]|nr:hypothetical protein [Terracidiphilus sp.]
MKALRAAIATGQSPYLVCVCEFACVRTECVCSFVCVCVQLRLWLSVRATVCVCVCVCMVPTSLLSDLVCALMRLCSPLPTH